MTALVDGIANSGMSIVILMSFVSVYYNIPGIIFKKQDVFTNREPVIKRGDSCRMGHGQENRALGSSSSSPSSSPPSSSSAPPSASLPPNSINSITSDSGVRGISLLGKGLGDVSIYLPEGTFPDIAYVISPLYAGDLRGPWPC